jgi:hypothetical protein
MVSVHRLSFEKKLMITRHLLGFLLALFLGILGCPRAATAGLVLSLDASTYMINGVGNTTSVKVFVSQDASGNQVGPTNALVSAGIEMSFLTAGTAVVLSTADVTPNPAWDSSSVVIKTSGANTLVDLGLTSLAGFTSLSPPLLLGTFLFTGQSLGTTSFAVSALGPGPSFGTTDPNKPVGDPTNTPEAQIIVSQTPVVPEPAGVVLLGIAGVTLGTFGWVRRRSKPAHFRLP